MDSLFADLFLAIQERIQTEVTDVSTIEQDFGQDQFDEWGAAVTFPALLIDFPSTGYSNMSGNNQIATTTIALRLLVVPFSQSGEGAPVEVKQDALEYFDLEKKICTALQGWTSDAGVFQPLNRIQAESNNKNNRGMRIRELQFNTSFEEYFD